MGHGLLGEMIRVNLSYPFDPWSILLWLLVNALDRCVKLLGALR
jgi:hypothetical protein